MINDLPIETPHGESRGTVKRGTKSQNLAALFLLGCLLFNYPLLSLFGRYIMVLDIPLLYIYLFTVWAALIALMATIVER